MLCICPEGEVFRIGCMHTICKTLSRRCMRKSNRFPKFRALMASTIPTTENILVQYVRKVDLPTADCQRL